ncbi:MAG: metalloregulator ArsR/SmtB family transcription factor [candidate division Zixibacteria bacterium]|nr:metalloregulator ArsR/SmtB family transcription factor [candidate division Zixibacteria bacterium]MDH3936983.1 metalloregulator ArsR/SmtB family transcription factor [candidate division Zixibacteria bacterium]MDH4035594.1 metalloregulator ArsR/SmtB family transcription factor [candidate division Zixibacteria bacterium]
MDARNVSRSFKAFAEPTRLRILTVLSSGRLSVSELVKAVGLAQPTVSRHLSVLRDSGFVLDRREGQQVVYSLNLEAIESCCKGFCDCLTVPGLRSRKTKEK